MKSDKPVKTIEDVLKKTKMYGAHLAEHLGKDCHCEYYDEFEAKKELATLLERFGEELLLSTYKELFKSDDMYMQLIIDHKSTHGIADGECKICESVGAIGPSSQMLCQRIKQLVEKYNG